MPTNWIVVGDTTTGGGTVVSGTPFTDVNGKPVARIGDPVQCGRHGSVTIATGDALTVIDGKPVARHGDILTCGCGLVSVSQSSVYIDPGQGASSFAIAISAASQALSNRPEPATASPMQFTGGSSAGDKQKARDAVRDANKALRDADAYRPYDTEIEAAQAWRIHVLRVADDHKVEIGAIIAQTADGKYHLGPAYSNGAYDNVTGLVEKGQYTQGRRTAIIHTHPHAGGWVGSDLELKYGDELEWVTMADGDRRLIGGIARGQDNRGDLLSAYYEQLNTYICDSAGLHGLDRPAFRRHAEAIIDGNDRGVYEQEQAVHE